MEILDPNCTGTVKIEYNPCVICLKNVNIAVDFNTPRESETSESANYFTSDNNESLLKLLTIDIELPNVSNRSKNCFLNSQDANDVAENEKIRNLNKENPELFATTIEREKHQGKQNNKAHFYCDSCFLRNKEILRIYSEIENLHKTFNCLRYSIEKAFKGGCIDEEEKVFQAILDDSDGVYWRNLRHQFAKSFKLAIREENYIENQELYHYYESPRIPSSSPVSPGSVFDADSSISQDLESSSGPDPANKQQSNLEKFSTSATSTSISKCSNYTIPLLNQSEGQGTTKNAVKNEENVSISPLKNNCNFKDVYISIKKLPDHIRPNMPVLINHSQTYLADLHRKQPLRKLLEPEPAKIESSRSRPTRNCIRNRGVKSYKDHQDFSISDNAGIILSDSDLSEKYETDVNLSDDEDFDVEDVHPPKKKRKPYKTKRKEEEAPTSSSLALKKSKPKTKATLNKTETKKKMGRPRKKYVERDRDVVDIGPDIDIDVEIEDTGPGNGKDDTPRIFCTVEGCKRRKNFASLELREIHIKQAHEGISHPFECPEPECERTFRNFRMYKIHIDSIHNNKYQYICHHCGKGFTISNNLRAHLVVHTNETPYKCPDCPKALRTREGLSCHRRYAHTGERPYQCHLCGKSFVRAIKLKNHIQCLHTKDRPYICELCGKGFPIQGYLYMHMRNAHGKAKSRGDQDGADQEEPQSKLGVGSEQLISITSTTTVMLPEDCENPGRISQTPPEEEEETPVAVAPFYSSPLPLLPIVPVVVDAEAPIQAPIILTTLPHNIPTTTNLLEHQYINLMTNLNVANDAHS